MEISGLTIYGISILNGLYGILSIIGWVGLMGLIILGIFKLVLIGNNGPGDLKKDGDCFCLMQKMNKYIKICCIGFIFGILGTIFVPTAKTMAAIYIIPKIVNNETLKNEANEMYGMAKEWLKETIGENKEAHNTEK
jgi:hypothetical protein